ncbi:hypothetical protein J4449_04445 [Candidatus Woesearchaeota archaeon]|nr:hypothetical protein [Candidatus Woesearchaeota archaeon]
MKEENKMSLKELKKFKEENLEVGERAFEVNEGICKDCKEKLVKIVENRSIFDGTISFHIIKLRCLKCGREYLDLDQAEKYDFLLALEKASKKEPLENITKKIVA